MAAFFGAEGWFSDKKAIGYWFNSRPGNSSLCSWKITLRLFPAGTELSTRHGGPAYRFAHRTENDSAL